MLKAIRNLKGQKLELKYLFFNLIFSEIKKS
jgi:hypothetical protein